MIIVIFSQAVAFRSLFCPMKANFVMTVHKTFQSKGQLGMNTTSPQSSIVTNLIRQVQVFFLSMMLRCKDHKHITV